MKLAVIDIGTNSTRMLIAKIENGKVIPIIKAGRVTRLGKGVKKTGKLLQESIKKTVETLKDFKKLIEKENVEKVIAVTTEAARIAENADEFLKEAKKLGIKITILSDKDEAELVYLANIYHFKPKEKAITVDLGGGSTEIVYGEGEKLIYFESLKFGVVFLLEKFIKSNPPTGEELKTLEKFIREHLRKFKEKAKVEKPLVVYGVGGTITSAVAMEEAMTVYDTEKVHGYKVDYKTILKWYDLLKSMKVEDRKEITGLEPGRADVIIPGLAFFKIFCEVFDIDEITVSELGLLYGIAFKEALKP